MEIVHLQKQVETLTQNDERNQVLSNFMRSVLTQALRLDILCHLCCLYYLYNLYYCYLFYSLQYSKSLTICKKRMLDKYKHSTKA